VPQALRTALPASREARLLLVGTLFSAIGRGLTLPFLFIYLTKVRDLDGSTVGLLVGWMGAVSLLLAPVAGTLIDRLGARYVLIPLQFVAASGSLLLAFADSALLAFGALTVLAVGFSGIFSGATTILAGLVKPEERQRTFGLSFTLLNLGIGTGGLIAGTFVDESRLGTFQVLYFGDAASFLVPSGILLYLRHVGHRVVKEPSADEVAAPKGGYLQVLRDGAFVQFFLFALVLTVVGYAQIEIGFTAFAVNVAEVSARVVSLAFAANTLVIVLLQLVVLRWLEGRSRTRALSVVALIFGLSWIVLGGAGLAGAAGITALAIAGVIICSMIFALGETLMSPVMPAITNALATDELRGRYNAMASMVWGISGVVGPVAAGPLIGNGLSTVWLVAAIVGCLVASLLALRLRRRLTPAQDGRTAPTSTEPVPVEPSSKAALPAAR
jgi:MFS family permease